jgi:hypothetical protein
MAIIDNKKTLHFGAKMYEDYTHHKDTEKKKLIYQGISTTTIPILYTQDFTLPICYGINRH